MNKSGQHPALKVAGSMWSGYRVTLIWYWSIFVIVYVGINLLLRHLGEVDESMWGGGIWEGSVYSPKIFLLVIGILVTPVSLASYVTFGITRKHFAWGSALLFVGLSFVCTVLTAVGYPIEQLLYQMAGGTGDLKQPPLLEGSMDYFILSVGYCLAGWLIGNGYYGKDWRVGTIICVAALVPIILMEIIADAGTSFALWLEVLMLLVVAGLLLAANLFLLRKVRIRRKLV
ncbi:hypothetical protein [Paenibacillus sp. PL2-23]|uniref:hypothetical protein n=1 Tax=Paenibacillus sp. PL2-23 TaxID=2100729 RepID=UPI0030F85398